MSKNLQDHTKMYNSIKQGNLHFTETIIQARSPPTIDYFQLNASYLLSGTVHPATFTINTQMLPPHFPST